MTNVLVFLTDIREERERERNAVGLGLLFSVALNLLYNLVQYAVHVLYCTRLS